jgi:hypothetical protein
MEETRRAGHGNSILKVWGTPLFLGPETPSPTLEEILAREDTGQLKVKKSCSGLSLKQPSGLAFSPAFFHR